ncbi:MAG: GNAT family N-acetyltransferase [Rhodospirillales bacterium]|nr:GNAT family N-acetyltransferase [Rhodospirillales bacterium]MBO6785295.1 GNAT family N-acetyltransferase [Rhodospirillales bacterium]
MSTAAAEKIEEPRIAARVADVIVREATDDDADAVIQLIDDVLSEFQGCVLKVDEEHPQLREPGSAYRRLGGRFWVAECQGLICGTVALTPTDAPGATRLRKLFISQAARGRGLGRTLCELVERTARDEMGADMMMLYTDSRFLDAHRLYEDLGYVRQPGLVHCADASNSIEYVYTKKL